MWKILNHEKPDDFVIATGRSHTVEEFLKIAFNHIDKNYEDFVVTSEKYFRPNEVNYLLGNSSKAKKDLNWEPQTDFKDLVQMMVESDIEIAKSEKLLLDQGLLSPSWEFPKLS